MPHDHLRLELPHRGQGHADDDQKGRAAEEEGQAELPAQDVGKDGQGGHEQVFKSPPPPTPSPQPDTVLSFAPGHGL